MLLILALGAHRHPILLNLRKMRKTNFQRILMQAVCMATQEEKKRFKRADEWHKGLHAPKHPDILKTGPTRPKDRSHKSVDAPRDRSHRHTFNTGVPILSCSGESYSSAGKSCIHDVEDPDLGHINRSCIALTDFDMHFYTPFQLVVCKKHQTFVPFALLKHHVTKDHPRKEYLWADSVILDHLIKHIQQVFHLLSTQDVLRFGTLLDVSSLFHNINKDGTFKNLRTTTSDLAALQFGIQSIVVHNVYLAAIGPNTPFRPFDPSKISAILKVSHFSLAGSDLDGIADDCQLIQTNTLKTSKTQF
jgi:hypothetical protein